MNDEDGQIEKKVKEERFRHDIEVFKLKTMEDIVNRIMDLNDTMHDSPQKMKFIFDQSLNNNIILKDAVNEFWKLVKSGKCPHCDAMSSRIKKVGNIKFFQTPFSKKVMKRMKKSGIDVHKDALDFVNVQRRGSEDELDSEDDEEKVKSKTKTKKSEVSTTPAKENEKESEEDSDEEDVDLANEDSHKYLHPLEIKEHIKKLWESDGDLLSIVFGNLISKTQNAKLFKQAIDDVSNEEETIKNDFSDVNVIKEQNDFAFTISSTGPHIFFIESIIVPPNRFRPENKGGSDGGTYLHGQTAVLTKLLNLSNELRRLSMRNNNLNITLDTNTDNLNSTSGLTNASDLESTHPVTMKDIITKWTEMQDSINILFDSTKAANKKDGDKNRGIKQLLEKKEGVYRTKMMGKRVNFAGRSVISPDPMVDADWVGIPLYIAQKLTFAECVTE